MIKSVNNHIHDTNNFVLKSAMGRAVNPGPSKRITGDHEESHEDPALKDPGHGKNDSLAPVARRIPFFFP